MPRDGGSPLVGTELPKRFPLKLLLHSLATVTWRNLQSPRRNPFTRMPTDPMEAVTGNHHHRSVP